uniref:FRIGIDA-like protein n=1 Tax=Zea mays TaxID=4577 RepID=A0A804P9Y0_MAIZE
MGTAAPAMMPTEDLEAAIAELPAKKGVLREAFHTLAACSPYPLPFTWEDLDAHVSSVQSSISRRFSQLRALEAAGTARSSKNKEEDNEGEEEQEEEEADDEIDNQKEEDREGGEDNKRDADEETLTTKVSAGQGKETEGEEELDGYAQGDGEEQGTEEEEMVEETTKKQLRGLPADGRKEFVEACKRMDAETLVEFVICFSISSKKLLSAMHHAPDPAALVLQVVKLLVSNKNFRAGQAGGEGLEEND